MKRPFTCTLIVLLALPAALWAADAQKPTTQPAATAAGAADQAFKNDKEKLSYAIGVNIATGLQRRDIDIDLDTMIKAMREVFSGGKTQMDFAESNQTIMKWQQEERARQAKEDAEQSEANKKAAEDFLAKNKDKAGVKTTDSGLQYQILKEGTGPSPKPSDMVKVNYRGTLIDGTEFDSSYKRGEPARFVVSQVIPGWQEAMPMMKVGGKWKLFIPPDLAYKNRRQGQHIGPNSLLIFEVELLGIEDAPKPMGTHPPTRPQ